MSHAEVAAMIGRETCQSISYQPLSEDEWNQQLAILGEVADTTTVQHLSATTKMWREDGDRFRAMAETDPDRLTHLLGRPPIRFADFIHEHRSDFLATVASSGQA